MDGDLEVDLAVGQAVWLTATVEITSADLDDFVLERPEPRHNPYGLKYLDGDWLAENPDIPHVHPHFRNSFLK